MIWKKLPYIEYGQILPPSPPLSQIISSPPPSVCSSKIVIVSVLAVRVTVICRLVAFSYVFTSPKLKLHDSLSQRRTCNLIRNLSLPEKKKERDSNSNQCKRVGYQKEPWEFSRESLNLKYLVQNFEFEPNICLYFNGVFVCSYNK